MGTAKGVLEKAAYRWGRLLKQWSRRLRRRSARPEVIKNARTLGQHTLPGGISYAGGAAFVFGRKRSAQAPGNPEEWDQMTEGTAFLTEAVFLCAGNFRQCDGFSHSRPYTFAVLKNAMRTERDVI